MTKRRTKKDRIKTKRKRKVSKTSDQSLGVSKSNVTELFHYDIKLIIKDLTKTLVASMVIIGVLVALYIKL